MSSVVPKSVMLKLRQTQGVMFPFLTGSIAFGSSIFSNLFQSCLASNHPAYPLALRKEPSSLTVASLDEGSCLHFTCGCEGQASAGATSGSLRFGPHGQVCCWLAAGCQGAHWVRVTFVTLLMLLQLTPSHAQLLLEGL